MNNQARICKLKCKYNVQNICSIYGDCMTKDLFISELEKIKAEIGAKVFEIQPASDKYFDGVDDVMDIVSSIIDKHIKENKA